MKTTPFLAAWTLALALGCGPASESPEAPYGSEEVFDPATAELATPAEESARAAESINAANAEEQLDRLESELPGG